jgi:hypothetical protein
MVEFLPDWVLHPLSHDHRPHSQVWGARCYQPSIGCCAGHVLAGLGGSWYRRRWPYHLLLEAHQILYRSMGWVRTGTLDTVLPRRRSHTSSRLPLDLLRRMCSCRLCSLHDPQDTLQCSSSLYCDCRRIGYYSRRGLFHHRRFERGAYPRSENRLLLIRFHFA